MLSRHTLPGRSRRRPRRKGLAAPPSPAAAALVLGRGPARLPVAPLPPDHPAERAFQEVVLSPTNAPPPFPALTFVAQERAFLQRLFIHWSNPTSPLLALGNITNN